MTEKEIFEVVKYFKSIYTAVNMADEFYIADNKIIYKANSFFIIYGELQNQENNPFIQWVNGKTTVVKLSDLNSVRECLKKNVKSIETDKDKFLLKYTDKDGNEKEFLCSNKINAEYQPVTEKIHNIQKSLTSEFKIDSKLFEEELLIVYLDGHNITTERTENKIVEIPSKRILSLQKGSETYLKISEKDTDGKRFVQISSKNELLELAQIFATI